MTAVDTSGTTPATNTPRPAPSGPPVFAGDVTVRSITEGSGVTVMTFDTPHAFDGTRAGQFMMVSSNRDGAPLLARPMSIIGTEPLEIAFGYQGEGTRLIAAAEPGEKLHLLGPLGDPFPPLGPEVTVVVEGAHFGTMLALCRERHAAGEATRVLFVTRAPEQPAGPVTAGEQDAALMAMFEPYADLTALNGDAVIEALEARHPGVVAAGAFDHVMARVQAWCEAGGVTGYAALQVAMPCGIGACKSCIKKFRDDRYHLVCDGPIFPLEEVAF
ncbi:hypothetical protein DLJ53_00300 [Acuticoccus sediminis]|uniref:FAD-binding FR-type domain-containing protein n=1 Tax=Acuticoccus sediminis TaxID=2184697 RepID=A0A8B2NZ90_9HYPH|nr:hypothetical protein [Acuticoccus sediminis]RAI03014.1 hypothetical protein DLJ53_00300 [Acuticoccus sediminis]